MKAKISSSMSLSTFESFPATSSLFIQDENAKSRFDLDIVLSYYTKAICYESCHFFE
jgi:hypothetical protein